MKDITIKQEHILMGLTFTTGFFIVFCGFLLYYLIQERQKNEDLLWENETLQEDLDEAQLPKTEPKTEPVSQKTEKVEEVANAND